MGFTVNDFQDMLVILEQHPEWRRRLLVLLLRDDFIQPSASADVLTKTVDHLADTDPRIARS